MESDKNKNYINNKDKNKDMNSINIDKILDEARNRKPRVSLEEVENLVRNTNAAKRATVNWKGMIMFGLFMLIAVFSSLYYFTNSNNKNENTSQVTAQKQAGEKQQNLTAPPLIKNTETTENNHEDQLVTSPQTVKKPVPGSYSATQKDVEITNLKPVVREKVNAVSESTNKSANVEIFPSKEITNNEVAAAANIKTKFSFRGWKLNAKAPQQFSYGLDKETAYKGNASAYINSVKSNYNSAWLTQEMSAAPYAGKHLKMSAMVKCKNPGKKAWAGIFMNIRGKDFKIAGFDNMYDKAVGNKTDWVKCELVMDIPAESKNISFGLYKVYAGDAWIDDIRFEVVNENVPLRFLTHSEAQDTSLVQSDLSNYVSAIIVDKPFNLDFEKTNKENTPQGWHIAEEKQHFRYFSDYNNSHSGKASVCLQSSGYKVNDWNTLMQFCNANNFLDKRLKISAWVRTEGLKEHAAFIFRVDEYTGKMRPENIREFTLTGENKWRKIELTLDIPETATSFSYGLFLTGKGKIWMDDITIEEVPAKNGKNTAISNRTAINLDFEE